MLTNLKEVSYSPLSTQESYKAELVDGLCSVKSTADQNLLARVNVDGEKLHLSIEESSSSRPTMMSLVAIEYLISHHPEIKSVDIKSSYPLDYPFTVLGSSFERFEFYQMPTLWHHTKEYKIFPEKWTKLEDGRTYPIRPAPHKGMVYKRFVPQLDMTITFRMTDPERDLNQFHEWHNQSRVSFYWELNKPIEELKDYMEKGHMTPHQIPMVVEINGEMVGYYEMYWVREDRLGPYYESDAFDRGFHFLIGNKKFLGAKITDSIVKSGLHLLYLDDARTRRVMAEPRHDNQKVLKYAEASIGWKQLKIFDFPHKRAVLLENSREVFFGGNAL